MVRVTATALLLVASGCGGATEDAPLRIFAAASLTEAFGELEQSFERHHAGLDVEPTFAGSQILRLQIEQGAPADVFASADLEHMEALVEAGHIEDSRAFASNDLVLIVPDDSPITTFENVREARRLVVGNPNVPIGHYTAAMLDRADAHYGEGFGDAVRARVVSEESSVRLVRAKVELGEADAAIVYRTDAMASAHVRVVTIPDAINVRARYHVGVVSASPRAALARQWITHTTGDDGSETLRAHGFAPEPRPRTAAR